MGLPHWVALPLAIAWTVVAKEKAGDVAFMVSIALFGLVARYRRNISQPSGIKGDVREVNDSLIEFHRPLGIPTVQVLFFHGLPLGKSSSVHLSTWECRDGSGNLWPQTWLVEEFPGAHVLVVRYSQALSKDSRKTFDMKIIRENLLSDLLQGKIGQERGCPVVLVGHSVGGLVIKQLCSEAHEKLSLTRDSRNDRVQLENFLNRITGIFYYATPHHGIPDIAKAAELLDSPLFKYFETLSTEAERLNSKFSLLCGLYPKWQRKGLAESLAVKSGVFRGIVVVPEASSREGEVNVDTADHFSISKPPSKTSRRFNALTQLLHNGIDAKEDARPENFQYVPQQIIGLGSRLQEVKERLQTATSLCLTGMGGSGKSTLAKVVFNAMGPKFDYTCFVSDVKLIKGNEEALKKEVWSQMCYNGKKVEKESDWSSIRGRQLLLVLDDISDERDQKVLSEIIASVASSESRFIATSRSQDLLDDLYQVPFLDRDSGRQLFVNRAFPNQVTPPANLASLVGQIVERCGGLPLTLEVVGQYLRKTEQEDDWKQALHALEKAEAVSGFNERLWEKLRLSYNGLEENEKQMFLDATTIFGTCDDRVYPRWTLGQAKVAWRAAYDVSENLLWRTLVERSLVYDVKDDEAIKVHEQLRSLGQKIASESNDKCRVWESGKALEVLQSTNEFQKQSLHALRLEKGRYGEDGADAVVHLASPNLQQLKNLRFLQIEVPVVVEANLDDKWFPRNLVQLLCNGLQLFDPARLSRLAILELQHMDAECLPSSIGQLSGLRIFGLWNASKLHSLPNEIGQLSQLESLTVVGCDRLKTVPGTLGQLSNLKYLRLRHCFSFQTLPESLGNLSALDHLELQDCGSLQTLPESFGKLSALTFLYIGGCDEFLSLPKSFGALCALAWLVLFNCPKLKLLPDSCGHLPAFTQLKLVRCGLKSLPESFGNLFTLSHLTLSKCPNVDSLPESLGQLTKLEYLSMSKLYGLEGLPNSLRELKALRHLIIKFTLMESIPDCIENLPSLQTLEVGLLPQVKELPPWLGDTDENSLAYSQKKFQVRDKRFSLIENTIKMESENDVVIRVHAICKWKVKTSDYAGALASLSVTNPVDPFLQGFFLQEKGIVKRMMGDLSGALEDLTAALEIFSKVKFGDCQIYDCSKHRGYVNFLIGNLESAENDGTMALKLLFEDRKNYYQKRFLEFLSPLGEQQVTYMHFKLEGRHEMIEHDNLMKLHSQVMQTAMASSSAESDFKRALASFGIINVNPNRAFFLQERGILKRFAANLEGALEDLTAALEILKDDYDCLKHRGYVKYLLGDLEGARMDAERASNLSDQESVTGPECLGGTPVKYLQFQL